MSAGFPVVCGSCGDTGSIAGAACPDCQPPPQGKTMPPDLTGLGQEA